jgi:hypothetical protein
MLKEFVRPREALAAGGTDMLLQTLVNFFDVPTKFVLFRKVL